MYAFRCRLKKNMRLLSSPYFLSTLANYTLYFLLLVTKTSSFLDTSKHNMTCQPKKNMKLLSSRNFRSTKHNYTLYPF